MEYIVIAIPRNRQYEDAYDTTTYHFSNLNDALNFIKIAINSSTNTILQLVKEKVGE